MTTVSIHNWLSAHPEYKQVTVEVEGRSVKFITPIRKVDVTTCCFYEQYLDKILKRVAEFARPKIEQGPGPISDFPLNVEPMFAIRGWTFKELIQDFQKDATIEEANLSKDLEKTTLQYTGLSLQEYVRLRKKVLDYALEFFSNCVMLIPYSEQGLCDAKITLERKAYDFLFEKMGIKKDPHPVQFQEETLQRFGFPKQAVEVLPTELSCLQFVLLEKGEVFAGPAIFQKGKSSFLESQLLHHIFDYLPLWGYALVEDPIEGDIVVYLDFKNHPAHVGIFKGNDRVYSKLGIIKEHAYEHSLFSVHDRALFYRKQ